LAFVYWLHLEEHDNPFTQGYVGVTTRNPERRLYEHKWWSLGKGRNPYLREAVKTHEKDIILTILIIGNEDYCYDIENKLRPIDRIGWNFISGGTKPPTSKGRVLTEEHKKRIGASNKGKSRGIGSSNPNWGKGAAKGKKWFHNKEKTIERYFSVGNEPENWIEGRIKFSDECLLNMSKARKQIWTEKNALNN
jgi:hypothetical protein